MTAVAAEPSPDGSPHLHNMLASAVAGQPVEVVAGGPGEHAWSDGHTITLNPTEDSRSAIEAVVVHAALIGAGSLSRELMRPLLWHSRLRRRFLRIEGPRAVAELRNLLPRSLDYMIRDDIAKLSDSPAGSLALARTSFAIPESGLYLGALRPHQVLAAMPNSSATPEAHNSGERSAAAEASTQPVPSTRMPDDSFVAAGNGSPLIGRLLHALLRGSGLAATDGPVGGRSMSQLGAAGRASSTAVIGVNVTNELVTSLSGKGFRYPEWDSSSGCYRPEWCTVRVVEPDEHPQGSMANPDLGMRRPLSRLGTGLGIRPRQPYGDDIDIDAAVEGRICALTAQESDGAFYLARVRDRRDLSALILLDVSGSTAEPGVGQVRIHDHQRIAVAALATTMQGLGDRVAVYGFSSHGRHNVRLTTLKTFAEYNERSLLARLSQLEPCGYSRLGAAIRHGASIIDQSGGTTRRLLIVVSDGLAFDHGYDLDHGARDVRRALAEVRSRGTGCLCLTVGATAPSEDLRLVFGTAAHAAVPRPDRLVPVIASLCRAALRTAEVHRHRSERRKDQRSDAAT
ncbi:von Willebrand factor type A domain-containing protein [Mycobacterium sp. 88mf]|nr:von Willebrand factor type A domain-containing protein [Mycobacterium sp. 88mf]SFF39089.1 von Willebrand factor type A domain-containing protein [Mycobacterium sp. 455mf]